MTSTPRRLSAIVTSLPISPAPRSATFVALRVQGVPRTGAVGCRIAVSWDVLGIERPWSGMGEELMGPPDVWLPRTGGGEYWQ